LNKVWKWIKSVYFCIRIKQADVHRKAQEKDLRLV